MKFQATTTLLAAASVHARSVHNVGRDLINIPNVEVAISGSVINSAAFVPFQNTRVLLKTPATGTKRQDVVTPDNIFVLQCTEAGFREPCLVFGAAPGDCGRLLPHGCLYNERQCMANVAVCPVSYFDFQPANSTAVSDIFWKNVTSLSVNTGGNCMFYQ